MAHTQQAKDIADAIMAEVIITPDLCNCGARDFSELHDYCDANCLGGMDEKMPEDPAQLETFTNDCNVAMEIVNAWLAARNG